ncbi:MAG: hypothetical protein RL568_1099 [Actinomycetota bacterium]
MGIPAFLGSAAGAVLASKIPTSSMRPMVLMLLIIVAIYTWFKPDLGKYENLRHLPKRYWILPNAYIGCIPWVRLHYR